MHLFERSVCLPRNLNTREYFEPMQVLTDVTRAQRPARYAGAAARRDPRARAVTGGARVQGEERREVELAPLVLHGVLQTGATDSDGDTVAPSRRREGLSHVVVADDRRCDRSTSYSSMCARSRAGTQ